MAKSHKRQHWVPQSYLAAWHDPNAPAVRKVVSSPMEHTLLPLMSAEAPLLVQMRFVVLCASGDANFITSDAPVVWYDPDAYKRPPLFRAPAFYCENLEITFPISPKQTLLLVHPKNGQSSIIRYVAVSDNYVHEINRRTRFHCHKEFVTNGADCDPRWFHRGVMPDDAWEKLNPSNTDDDND